MASVTVLKHYLKFSKMTVDIDGHRRGLRQTDMIYIHLETTVQFYFSLRTVTRRSQSKQYKVNRYILIYRTS